MTGAAGPITVYTANSSGGGILRTALRLLREIHTYRYLIWTLFTRDFKAQFKQSILGYAWTALGPILGVFSFVFMNYMGILNPGPTAVPYPIYAFVGISLWGFLTSTIAIMSGGLNAQSDLIMRTNIPKIALAASALASIIYGTLVNLILIALFVLGFRMPVSWASLSFPVLILPLIVLGLGIGLAVSVIGIIAKDVSRLASQFFTLLMFLTPVIFVSDHIRNPLLQMLIMANPLTYLVELPRSVLLAQPTAYWPQYLGASAGCFLVLLIGLKVFDMVQDLVAERL
jgi:lipopolysaccharide transport system permease protein